MAYHPWRTVYPLKPKIAILPVLVDQLGAGDCQSVTIEQMKAEVWLVVEQIPIYSSVRYVFISCDYRAQMHKEALLKILSPAGVVGEILQDQREQCGFAVGFTSNHAHQVTSRWPDPTYYPNPYIKGLGRNYSFHMVGQVNSNSGYAERLAIFASEGFLPSPYIVTEYEDHFHNPKSRTHLKLPRPVRRCHDDDYNRCLRPYATQNRLKSQRAQERSNYTLVLRGDNAASDRWIQAMAAGTALVSVVDEKRSELEWLPHRHAVP